MLSCSKVNDFLVIMYGKIKIVNIVLRRNYGG